MNPEARGEQRTTAAVSKPEVELEGRREAELLLRQSVQQEMELIESARARASSGAGSVLVVDDDALQREVIGDALRALGYTVQTVADGKEAVAYLRQRSAEVLILDMVMPGGADGAETYRQALELHPGQKALFVSGFSPSVRVLQALALGPALYLRKPVGVADLRAVLQRLLG